MKDTAGNEIKRPSPWCSWCMGPTDTAGRCVNGCEMGVPSLTVAQVKEAMTKPRSHEEIAERPDAAARLWGEILRYYRVERIYQGTADSPDGVSVCLAALREAADAARQEEREALRGACSDFMDDTVDWLLRMNRTADPGTDEPKNFEPDLRTRAAIAAWLMDSRKPILLALLDARSRAEEPKP